MKQQSLGVNTEDLQEILSHNKAIATPPDSFEQPNCASNDTLVNRNESQILTNNQVSSPE